MCQQKHHVNKKLIESNGLREKGKNILENWKDNCDLLTKKTHQI